MVKQEAIGTTRSEEWATPLDLFDSLNSEFHFRLDPCCTAYEIFTTHMNFTIKTETPV